MGVKGLGALLVLMAVGSLVLPFVGVQFSVFARFDQAGLGMGLLVRALILVMGIFIYRVGDQME